MKHSIFKLFVFFFIVVGMSTLSIAGGVKKGDDQTMKQEYRPGVLIVKFTKFAVSSPNFKISIDGAGIATTGIPSIDILNKNAGVKAITKEGLYQPKNVSLVKSLGIDRIYLFKVSDVTDIKALAEKYNADPNIEYAEPDWKAYLMAVPNDPLYSSHWGHNNTAQMPSYDWSAHSHTGPTVGTVGFDANAQGAWDNPQGYGSSSVIIGIIDTGVDWNHEDLRIWNNSAEIPGNSTDDDGNGFIDDVRGWDFGDNDNDPNDNSGSAGHGTACAGVAAAVANNNIGIVGIAGGCTIMPLKVANNAGNLYYTAITNALNYGADNGADVLSMSLGGSSYNQSLQDACTYAWNSGSVVLAATGNGNNSSISYPAGNANVIGVGAASNCGDRKRSSSNPSEVNSGVSTDPNGYTCDGERWWGSNYGVNIQDADNAVDVIAPTILPTTDITGSGGYDPGNYDMFFNGTSCATPYAAGVCALIISKNPTWTPNQVRAQLVATAYDIVNVESGVGWDRYTGYGMVDAQAATGAGIPSFSANPTSLDFGKVNGGSTSTKNITVTNTGTADLIISSVISTSSRFSVSPTNATINPGGNTVFSVTFSPIDTTYQEGEIRFTHNASGSPSVVTVSGNPSYLLLIDPNGDGGFENGSDFASNGWTVVNGAQTNKWYVGTATKVSGTKGGYISNDGGTTNAYTISSASVVHFYRDVTFPANSISYELSFDWKCAGEVNYDFMKVYLVETTTTPVAGTQLSSGQIGASQYNNQTTYTTSTITGSATAGTTKRFVFSWRNDSSDGTQPPVSIDNISLKVYRGIITTTSIIDPNGDGGFENGSDFASNGWTVVNGTQTNKWYVGTATKVSGTKGGYISNDGGTTNAYTTSSTSVVHFYRNVTFPSDATSFELSFDWKGYGESGYDFMKVYLVETTTTPVAGTQLSSGQIGASAYNLQSSYANSGIITIDGANAGTTKRLVFSWRNDSSVGTQPPAAIDNISLVAKKTQMQPDQFTEDTFPLTSLRNSSVAFGDYNGDGKVDLVVSGLSSSDNPITKLYKNTGSTYTADYSRDVNLIGVYDGSLAFADIDNDKDLDLLVSGNDGTNGVCNLYKNEGGYGRYELHQSLTGVKYSAVAFGDYDNDGDMDLVVTGMDNSNSKISKLYKNNGGTFTEDTGSSLLNVYNGSVVFFDYDNDRDLDLLIVGQGNTNYAKLYKNTNGIFSVDNNSTLLGVFSSSVGYGDYDNDGDLDLLISGRKGDGTPSTRLYKNTNGVFIYDENSSALEQVMASSVAFGDYDNDGYLDLVIGGSKGYPNYICKLYKNNGSGIFIEDTDVSLPGIKNGAVAFGDYDGDYDLDLFVTGQYTAKLYKNNEATVNTRPNHPYGLSSSSANGKLTLSWNAPVDNTTSKTGLTYNIRVGTSPGGSEICSAKVPVGFGNRGLRESIVLNLGVGTYYWSVQAVDNSLVGSTWATEQTAVHNTTPSSISRIDSPTTFALSQNYPNPFNPETVISYQLPVGSNVELKIYSITGQLVRTLVSDKQDAGYYNIRWNGKDDNGNEVSSGLYIYTIKAGEFSATKRMVMVK